MQRDFESSSGQPFIDSFLFGSIERLQEGDIVIRGTAFYEDYSGMDLPEYEKSALKEEFLLNEGGLHELYFTKEDHMSEEAWNSLLCAIHTVQVVKKNLGQTLDGRFIKRSDLSKEDALEAGDRINTAMRRLKPLPDNLDHDPGGDFEYWQILGEGCDYTAA